MVSCFLAVPAVNLNLNSVIFASVAEWPEDWNMDDNQMLKLTTGSDINREFIGFKEIEGLNYASYKFPSFSPYAIIDKLSEEEQKELWWNQNKEIITGLGVIAILLFSVITSYLLILKKRKKSDI